MSFDATVGHTDRRNTGTLGCTIGRLASPGNAELLSGATIPPASTSLSAVVVCSNHTIG